MTRAISVMWVSVIVFARLERSGSRLACSRSRRARTLHGGCRFPGPDHQGDRNHGSNQDDRNGVFLDSAHVMAPFFGGMRSSLAPSRPDALTSINYIRLRDASRIRAHAPARAMVRRKAQSRSPAYRPILRRQGSTASNLVLDLVCDVIQLIGPDPV